MVHLLAIAVAFTAVGSAAQQTRAVCVAEASSVEASLLQSHSAFERRSAGGAKDEVLVEDAAGIMTEAVLVDDTESLANSAVGQQQPGKKKAKAVKEIAEADAAEAEAGTGDSAEATPAGKQAIVSGAAAGATQIEPFGREDTAAELQSHAAKTQNTLVDAVENAEVAEIKRSVFRALTRLRAAEIKEFDTIARLETQSIDEYNDDHHYRGENPLIPLHASEAEVEDDKLSSFHR